MNNRAFTLVELLAVIVILSLLALLTSTAITNLLSNAKGDLSSVQIELIESAAKTWGANNISKLPNNGCSYITLKDLKDFGLLDSDVVDPKTNKGISDDLKIKVTSTEGKQGNLVIEYEVNPENIEGCYWVYLDTVQEKLEEILLSSENNDSIFEDEHNNIRYRGATPDNYVKFNNEDWRIIGYVDGHVKLIKDKSIGNMAWDASGGQYGSNDWTRPADLMKYLNPSEVNKTDTDGEYWSKTLSEEAKNMIEKVTWSLGPLHINTLLSAEFYKLEREKNIYGSLPVEWEGYVGLIYPSDYGYAASSECSTNTEISSYYLNCQDTDWLTLENNAIEWTLSPVSGIPYDVFYLGTERPKIGIGNAGGTINIRPVINLKSNVKIVDGDGSKANPFKLGY